MPRDPPVTSATFPLRSNSLFARIVACLAWIHGQTTRRKQSHHDDSDHLENDVDRSGCQADPNCHRLRPAEVHRYLGELLLSQAEEAAAPVTPGLAGR
jgi:hypothetical protein